MKRRLLLVMLAFTISIFVVDAQACQHSVDLSDPGWGDGWNGGTLTIKVNDVTVLDNVTLATGAGPVTYYFDATNGDDIDALYTPGGWPYENLYVVYDGAGGELGRSGYPSGNPDDIYNMVGYCAAPIPVSNWAIFFGVLLIVSFMMFRFRRKLA